MAGGGGSGEGSGGGGAGGGSGRRVLKDYKLFGLSVVANEVLVVLL